ncbi:NAD(+) diphosphatase [Marinobacter sp. X15-166B]|uniref:NAD(+) diphosphatase n=1 Tax=Marinobacter sp. X15-166B TaxID=1897620 RepID=UPI00085BCD62|nr:NAD(+) diphosphatase [Marinobacter sp. X15-166B]OEY66921.1 NADH pyrophosphatase [Marinobacter sp. X15-166B]
MTHWQAGWSRQAPTPQDKVVGVAGTEIIKPPAGWLLDLPEARSMQADRDEPVYVGRQQGREVYVMELDPARVGQGYRRVTLREALLGSPQAPAEMLSMAFQVKQWRLDNRYCGRCGEPTGEHPLERARWCERCQIPWYPRLAPCVIVVIRKGEQVLLARSSRATSGYYSLIAGFVEPGETVEAAVAREVREETGFEVTNIRYHSSQPWPFPHQLMLGFFADYAGGDMVLQADELADAGWFYPGERPPIPPATTISGALIRAMEAEIRG